MSVCQSCGACCAAFRVDFQGEPPPAAERYWRGPVLTRFDGHTWRAGLLQLADQPSYQPQGAAYSYAITLEPHNQLWLLALDVQARWCPPAWRTT